MRAVGGKRRGREVRGEGDREGREEKEIKRSVTYI